MPPILICFYSSHSESPRVLTNNYGNYSVRLWIYRKMHWIVACFVLACTIQAFKLMQSSLISCSQYGQQMRHHLEIRCKIEVSSLKLVFEVCKRDNFLITVDVIQVFCTHLTIRGSIIWFKGNYNLWKKDDLCQYFHCGTF